MSFFKTVVGGALGFMVGGPLGAAGGAVLANSFGGGNYKYNINCPHCHKSLGVNEYGIYNCSHCGGNFEFSTDGVIKNNSFNVICPYCNGNVLIDSTGIWNCCHCKNSFEYGEDNRIRKHDDEENTYIFIIFAAYAKFCKINGSIKNSHIKVLNDIINNYYGFDEENRKKAIECFRKGRDSDRTFEDYCVKLNNSCDDNLEEDRNLKNGFLDCLYKIATFGGKATYGDEKMLDYAAAVLKIEPYVINSIKAEYMDNTLDKYYEILGCKKGDDLPTIKSKYRKLVGECHPDKILNKDLPDYLVEYSTQRFREVQEAYEKIRVTLGA